jgi:hypothetical protein
MVCGTASQDVRQLVQERDDTEGMFRGRMQARHMYRVPGSDPRSMLHASDAFTTRSFLFAVQSILVAQFRALAHVLGLSEAPESGTVADHMGAGHSSRDAPVSGAELRAIGGHIWHRYLSRWTHTAAPIVHVIEGRVVTSEHPRYMARLHAEGLPLAPNVPLTMPLLLATVYCACRWLQLPVLPTDILAWVRNGTLPYLNAYRGLDATARASLHAAEVFLSPLQAPTPRRLHRLSRALCRNVGIHPLPALNAPLCVVRLCNRLRIPEIAIPRILALANLDITDRLHSLAYYNMYERDKHSHRASNVGQNRVHNERRRRALRQQQQRRRAERERRRQFILREINAGRRRAGGGAVADELQGDEDADEPMVENSDGGSGNGSGSASDSADDSEVDDYDRDIVPADELSWLRRSVDCDTAEYIAALVAVGLRLWVGWKDWVEDTFKPGSVGGVVTRRARLGLTVGPWANEAPVGGDGWDEEHDSIRAAAAAAADRETRTQPPLGASRDPLSASPYGHACADDVSAGILFDPAKSPLNRRLIHHASASSGSYNLPVTAELGPRVLPFLVPHPDIPLPWNAEQAVLMPRSLSLSYAMLASATALSGGDAGVGRAAVGYPLGDYGPKSVIEVPLVQSEIGDVVQQKIDLVMATGPAVDSGPALSEEQQKEEDAVRASLGTLLQSDPTGRGSQASLNVGAGASQATVPEFSILMTRYAEASASVAAGRAGSTLWSQAPSTQPLDLSAAGGFTNDDILRMLDPGAAPAASVSSAVSAGPNASSSILDGHRKHGSRRSGPKQSRTWLVARNPPRKPTPITIKVFRGPRLDQWKFPKSMASMVWSRPQHIAAVATLSREFLEQGRSILRKEEDGRLKAIEAELQGGPEAGQGGRGSRSSMLLDSQQTEPEFSFPHLQTRHPMLSQSSMGTINMSQPNGMDSSDDAFGTQITATLGRKVRFVDEKRAVLSVEGSQTLPTSQILLPPSSSQSQQPFFISSQQNISQESQTSDTSNIGRNGETRPVIVEHLTGLEDSLDAEEITYYPRRLQSTVNRTNVVEAKAPRDLTVYGMRYRMLLEVIANTLDCAVEEILSHCDVLELLLQHYTPIDGDYSGSWIRSRASDKHIKSALAKGPMHAAKLLMKGKPPTA